MSTVEDIKARLDIMRDVIIPNIGQPVERGSRWRFWWRCPFHDDHDPSLALTPNGERFQCFACGAGNTQRPGDPGDMFDWVMRYNGVSFKEAKRLLAQLAGLSPTGQSSPTPRPAPPAPAPTPQPRDATPAKQWQRDAAAAIRACEETLWSDHAQPVQDYLEGRGLTEAILREFHVGYCSTGSPKRYGRTFGSLWVPRGITIPTFAGGVPWRIKIRLMPGVPFKCGRCQAVITQPGVCPECEAKNKYRGVKGNSPSLFGADHLRANGRPLVLCEGEFDAMIVTQEAYGLVDVASLAGAGRSIAGRWLAYLLPYERILAAYDTDQAGRGGAGKLAQLSGRVERLKVPAHDVNDYYLAGGNVLTWIQDAIGSQEVREKTPAPSRPAPQDKEQTESKRQPSPQPSAAPDPIPDEEHVPGVMDTQGQPVTWVTVRAVYDLSELRRSRGFGDGGDAMLKRLGIEEYKARVLGAAYGQ